jgi:hypothetical protein
MNKESKITELAQAEMQPGETLIHTGVWGATYVMGCWPILIGGFVLLIGALMLISEIFWIEGFRTNIMIGSIIMITVGLGLFLLGRLIKTVNNSHIFVSNHRVGIRKYVLSKNYSRRNIPIDSIESVEIIFNPDMLSSATTAGRKKQEEYFLTGTVSEISPTTHFIGIKLKHKKALVRINLILLETTHAAIQAAINAQKDGLDAIAEFQRIVEAAQHISEK